LSRAPQPPADSSPDWDLRLAALVAQFTQQSALTARETQLVLRNDIASLHSKLESKLQDQSDYADRAIYTLRQDIVSTHDMFAEHFSSVDETTSSHAAHLRDLEAAFHESRQHLAWSLEQQADLSARLEALEQCPNRLLTSQPARFSVSSHPSTPVDAPRLLTSSARRVQNEVPSTNEVSALTSTPSPETSTVIQWRNNSSKSHCDEPVNFPPSLLLTYDHTGFPTTAFQHFCAGHHLPTDVIKPSLAAPTPAKKLTSAISVDRQYTGMILDDVTPVNLIRFWLARRAYSRLNGQEPIIAALHSDVSAILERKYSNTDVASDSTIWAALWDICELTPANLPSTFTDIANDFRVSDFSSLHDEASRSYVSKFSTAIINAVPYWPSSAVTLKTMTKMFTDALPKPCQQALKTYFDVYSTIRAGSRLLVSIEPWNLYIAVTVLESFLAYSKTQASVLLASGLLSHTVPSTSQHNSANPVNPSTTTPPRAYLFPSSFQTTNSNSTLKRSPTASLPLTPISDVIPDIPPEPPPDYFSDDELSDDSQAITVMMLSPPAISTPYAATTACRFGDLVFTAVADSGSGADIIHPRVLDLLSPSFPLPSPQPCNVIVVTANHERIRVSDFINLSFSLPLVHPTTVFARQFLIMPIPYDVVLSFDTLRSTGLGHIIFKDFPPTSALAVL